MASQVKGSVGWSLEVERARRRGWLVGRGDCPSDRSTGRPFDMCDDAGSFGVVGDVVMRPPVISWRADRGTRNSRPTGTTGSPSRPSVSRHLRDSAYAAVRPMRNTRAASSTVKKSGGSEDAVVAMAVSCKGRVTPSKDPTTPPARGVEARHTRVLR